MGSTSNLRKVRCPHQPWLWSRPSLHPLIDWDREVRGPVNLIGGGYGIFKHNVMEKSEELISDLHGELVLFHNEDGTPEYSSGVEVSYRNNVPIKVKEVIHKK